MSITTVLLGGNTVDCRRKHAETGGTNHHIMLSSCHTPFLTCIRHEIMFAINHYHQDAVRLYKIVGFLVGLDGYFLMVKIIVLHTDG